MGAVRREHRLLFEPLRLGSRILKNRIVVAPLTTCREVDGQISEDSTRYWTAFARGGAGLLVLGDVAIHEPTWVTPSLCDDRFIDSLRGLVEAVHGAGAKLAVQLYHRGCDVHRVRRHLQERGLDGVHALIRDTSRGFINRIGRSELANVRRSFGAAARRAIAAGVDVIQIHGDHLLGQLASPVMNRRGDEFGGSLDNRLRFALEVVSVVRDGAPDTPLDYKLPLAPSSNEEVGGFLLEEVCEAVEALERVGVDGFHVSTSCNHGNPAKSFPRADTQSADDDAAALVKACTMKPVTAVGSILSPDVAARIIKENRADLVAMARALICDPEWPRKVAAGRLDEIDLCSSCNIGCVGRLLCGRAISCARGKGRLRGDQSTLG